MTPPTPSTKLEPPPPRLTDREVEVLELLAQGLTAAEIAARLFISIRTVQFHTTRLREAFGSRTSAGAVGAAYRRGVLPRHL